jgi:NDP-sugar pyrophosphorylase family protein
MKSTASSEHLELPLVVLAGGLATRLRPLTEKIPKALIPINDRPFCLHQLDHFVKNGLNDIHYALGFLGEQVEATLSAFDFAGKMSFHYDGSKLLGTGGAVKKIAAHWKQPFFLTYGDSYLPVNFKEVLASYNNDPRPVGMTIISNADKWDKSNVEFENGNLIYCKKNPNAKMKYVDYGLLILDPSRIEFSQWPDCFDLSDLLEALSKKKQVMGITLNERFYEIGSHQGIKDFSDYLNSL